MKGRLHGRAELLVIFVLTLVESISSCSCHGGGWPCRILSSITILLMLKFFATGCSVTGTYSCVNTIQAHNEVIIRTKKEVSNNMSQGTRTYTPISKNVGENSEWHLSNGNCTTEKNCGFHIWYAKTMSSSPGAKLILGN